MTEYRNPKPTVDILIELDGQPGTLVFIERAHEPQGLALPGGFVDEGEWVADAAVREAKEETGLDVELVELFHVYSNPSRDPRQHTVSTVFIGRATGTPIGGDDAARAIVCAPDALSGQARVRSRDDRRRLRRLQAARRAPASPPVAAAARSRAVLDRSRTARGRFSTARGPCGPRVYRQGAKGRMRSPSELVVL